MNYTTQDIVRMIAIRRDQIPDENTRELVLVENAQITQNTREVYKDRKIERINDRSRDAHEEPVLLEVSCETYRLGLHPSDDGISSLGIQSQNDFDSDTDAHTRTSSREEYYATTFSGISVQHVKTKRGVKLNVNLQTDLNTATTLELTAELKQYGRIYELKPYEPDSEYFAARYTAALDDIKALKKDGKNVCVGRLHTRNKRAAWFRDIFMVGFMNDLNVIEKTMLFYEQQEYEIVLDGQRSPGQEVIYHATGIYGKFITDTRSAPSVTSEIKKRLMKTGPHGSYEI
jgi:hypothetical protein